jgi:aquaporin Z
MLARLARHWPEYASEATLLALFMLSASAFGVLLFHPESPVHAWLHSPLARRAWMGAAMGLTAVALVYSPLGKRSGAHMNPSVTLGFLALGRVRPGDAVAYVLAQFAGGLLGMQLAAALLARWIAHPEVSYVVTLPGARGVAVAFLAEAAISFVLFSVVLRVSGIPGLARWTGLCSGVLVMLYITFEAPLSGMSMNPARSFGSAFAARLWSAYWLYLTAPVLGMLAAAALYARTRTTAPGCAKLHHQNRQRCIFCGANQARGKS